MTSSAHITGTDLVAEAGLIPAGMDRETRESSMPPGAATTSGSGRRRIRLQGAHA
jgi:hypothetical protein